MESLWILLDKIGIVFGILLAIVEIGQWVYLHQMGKDIEEIQEDMDDD